MFIIDNSKDKAKGRGKIQFYFPETNDVRILFHFIPICFKTSWKQIRESKRA